ncbi:MAG: sulfur carrier protein ThiS [Phycisphaerae bacterium]|nr:sulfur carrier protein ThiS [Phycisphaerae bacterium]
MKLIINGKDVETDEAHTVTELLKEQKVKWPDMVSVELNGTILKRETFASTGLNEGDKVEFLYFMGGGRESD